MQLTVKELTEHEYRFWDKLVQRSPQRSIFAQRWWMDIVTGGGVRLLGCFDEDRLMAGIPIWPCRMLGINRLRQPPLTPYWGPLLMPLEGKYYTQLSGELEILRALADALLAWPDITMAFHPSLTNWLPFFWSGFGQTTRYTHRIEQLAQNLPTSKGVHRSVRNALNRAESNGLVLREMGDPMLVAEMSRMSMARQDVESSAEIRAFWPELSRVAKERACYFDAAAVDAHGNVHSAFAMVWDDRYAYDLYGGGDPQYRESGGGTLVVQRLLTIGATVAPSFDFEGSMIESIARFFRQFGGELTPYFGLNRHASTRLNFARALRGWREGIAQTTQKTLKEFSSQKTQTEQDVPPSS